jgi:4,5-DOPA dioxygenase extradiol
MMDLNQLGKIAEAFPNTPTMPALFLGHGSPMNAIEENSFVVGFRQIAKTIPKPKAIICISAHWETKGTFVTAMANPKTIHDFGGFPQSLFDVQYPAPGDPILAKAVKQIVSSTTVQLDEQWGLDHGAWSVIKHLYPNADVPIIQMSLDYRQSAAYHYALAKDIASLRNKGILIIGSGNMVHNLRMVDWQQLNTPNYAFDWAIEASDTMKHLIANDLHDKLIQYQSLSKAIQLAIPTPEHYLPLLYTLGVKSDQDTIQFFNDQAVGGSLTMTSLVLG